MALQPLVRRTTNFPDDKVVKRNGFAIGVKAGLVDLALTTMAVAVRAEPVPTPFS